MTVPQVGFFIDAPSVYGQRTMSDVFNNVAALHNVTGNFWRSFSPPCSHSVTAISGSAHQLNSDCMSSLPPSLTGQCFFAQRSLQHISTPIFILNSRNDNWQLQNIVFAEPQPPCTPQRVRLPACCMRAEPRSHHASALARSLLRMRRA
jgi:hypothetical protein